MRDLCAAILNGGGATRMGGVDKGSLCLGGQSFLQLQTAALAAFDEKWYSTAGGRVAPSGFLPVGDPIPGCGPLGGLYGVLRACRATAVLVIPCDVPRFGAALADYLAGFAGSGWNAWACRTRDGRLHPLCGVYTKACLPALEQALAAGNYRAGDWFRAVGGRALDLTHTVFADEQLANVNTPADLHRLEGVPVLAVCGAHNSGKTTLLERLLPALAARGLRVAVLKHDGHEFTPDVPGTDSDRLRRAGAAGVALYSGRQTLVWAPEGGDPARLAAGFAGCDLVLLEGGKSTNYPKLWLTRPGTEPLPEPKNLWARVGPEGDFAPDETEKIAGYIVNRLALRAPNGNADGASQCFKRLK